MKGFGHMNHGRVALMLLGLVVIAGTAGYQIIMDWSVTDALYMTMITLSTVGYGEVQELDGLGRLFTMALIFFGVGTLAYSTSALIRYLIEGEMHKVMGRKKVEKRIDKTSNHTIVCGYGRTGHTICRMMDAYKHDFIIVESNHELLEDLDETGWLYVKGDATDEHVLKKAGLERAQSLITVLGTDPDNLYVVLTARQESKDITIVARAAEENSERKMLVAGADKVINPYVVGGNRMAYTILKPTVVEMFEQSSVQDGSLADIQLNEIPVMDKSEIVGKKVRDSGIRQKLGLIIMAIKRKKQPMIFNPNPDCVIQEGDIMVVIGKTEDLKTAKNMVSP